MEIKNGEGEVRPSIFRERWPLYKQIAAGIGIGAVIAAFVAGSYFIGITSHPSKNNLTRQSAPAVSVNVKKETMEKKNPKPKKEAVKELLTEANSTVRHNKKTVYASPETLIKRSVLTALSGKGKSNNPAYNSAAGPTMQNAITASHGCRTAKGVFTRTYSKALEWSVKNLGINWAGKGGKGQRAATLTEDMISPSAMSKSAREGWLAAARAGVAVVASHSSNIIAECKKKTKHAVAAVKKASRAAERQIRHATTGKRTPAADGQTAVKKHTLGAIVRRAGSTKAKTETAPTCTTSGRSPEDGVMLPSSAINTWVQFFNIPEPKCEVRDTGPDILPIHMVRGPGGRVIVRILPAHPGEDIRDRQILDRIREIRATVPSHLPLGVPPIHDTKTVIDPGPVRETGGGAIPGKNPDANNPAMSGNRQRQSRQDEKKKTEGKKEVPVSARERDEKTGFYIGLLNGTETRESITEYKPVAVLQGNNSLLDQMGSLDAAVRAIQGNANGETRKAFGNKNNKNATLPNTRVLLRQVA